MSMLQLVCPCGMPLELPESASGTTVECPHCRKRITIPFLADAVRDELVARYSADIPVVATRKAPATISETLFGAMKSALSHIRPRDESQAGQQAAGKRELEFKQALLEGIRMPGFRMADAASRFGMDRKEVGAAVKEIYRAFFGKCIEDGLLSSAEREAMAAVAQRLCLHPGKQAELEAEVTGTQLRSSLQGKALDGRIDANEMESMRAMIRNAGQEWSACVRVVRDLAIQIIERRFAFARADGVITRGEAEEIRRLAQFFELVGRDIGYIAEALDQLRLLSSYAEGTLPVVEAPPAAGLAEDELCHWADSVWVAVPHSAEEAAAAKGAREGVKRATLWVTNGRLKLASEPALEVALADLEPIREEFAQAWQDGAVRSRRFVFLSAPGMRSPLKITCHKHEVLRAILTGAVHNTRRSRTAVAGAPASVAAQVDAGVRSQVWRRDQGACAVCGGAQELGFERTVPDARLDDPQAFRVVCRQCREKEQG